MKKFIFMVVKYKWLKIASPSLGRLHEKPYSYFLEMATSPSKTGVEVGKGAKEAFKKGLGQYRGDDKWITKNLSTSVR